MSTEGVLTTAIQGAGKRPEDPDHETETGKDGEIVTTTGTDRTGRAVSRTDSFLLIRSKKRST